MEDDQDSLEELQTLPRVMKESQKAIVRAFTKSQSCELRWCKWHAPSRIADEMETVGRIKVLNGGIYESEHKKVKELYSLSSTRCSEAFQETNQLYNEHDHIDNIRDGQLAVCSANLGRR